ncbi:MAG: hydantoinase/oxoprolinase family protein, partial [Hyphomicrobiaceae bacterium]
MSSNKRFSIGVDVGGTFTDIFIFDLHTGTSRIVKTPSTLVDQSRGLISGIQQELTNFSEILSVIHGTTTGTNALLERAGAETGIITSFGFRDVLEMRRRDRPTTWGLWGTFTPVVRRDRRLEVAERTLQDGTIVEAIDPNEVRAQARRLLELECQSVCIFFINSYANDANERAAAAAVREIWPNAYVTISTEVLPEIREFERVSTGSLNAYLQPVVSSYLDRVDAGLRANGEIHELLIVQSNGGLMSVETAKSFPVRTALSGPAAGVRAAQAIASAAGHKNIITCDLGGTSFDVSLIADGHAALAAQTQIDFGLVIRAPMIEITTIGAGGGSIARVDAGGYLQVGPQSAGSYPGPVCYGNGNDQPTLTDANLALGRINAARPIGGELEYLDREAADDAIKQKIAIPLGLDMIGAAEAIVRVANAKMAGAIRLISIERGHDPSKYLAMPFGGGGALHAGALIHECGLRGAIVPRYPGVTSALGCIVADMRHDTVHTVNGLLANLELAPLEAEMRNAGQKLQAVLAASGVTFDRTETRYEFDMLYVGQTHTVSVPIDLATSVLSQTAVVRAFEATYESRFGRRLEGIGMRVINYRVTAIGNRPAFDLRGLGPPQARPARECIFHHRNVYAGGAWHKVPIYDRLAIATGETIAGPCLLEQPDATIFLDPGLEGRIDDCWNVVIER